MTENLDKIEIEEVVAYIEKISKLKLIKEQIEVLKNLIDFNIKKQILCCGRAFSKSFLCAGFSLFLADVYSTRIGKPITILLISHQSEIYVKMDTFFYNFPELVKRLRVKGDKYSMPQEGFQFSDNMSRVLIRLDTSHQIRGIHSDWTIIDEAQSVEESIVFKDAMPTATEGVSKFILVGTPESGTYFTEKLKNAKKKKSSDAKEWIVSNYPSTVCPWLTKQIEQWKHELSREDFTTEIEAQVPDPTYNPPWNKKKLTRRFIEETETPLRRPNYYSMCGLDLGILRNPCALVGIERSKSKLDLKVIFVKTYAPNSWMEIANQIKTDRYKFCMCDSRPKELSDKVKMYVEPVCRDCKFYYVDAQGRKDSMIAQMVSLVNDGHITIPKPYGEPLYKEMYRYWRGKESGCNLTDALVLSCYQSPDYPLILTDEPNTGGCWVIATPEGKVISNASIFRSNCPDCGVSVIVNEDPQGKLVYCPSCYDKRNPRKSSYSFTPEQQEKMSNEFKKYQDRM